MGSRGGGGGMPEKVGGLGKNWRALPRRVRKGLRNFLPDPEELGKKLASAPAGGQKGVGI